MPLATTGMGTAAFTAAIWDQAAKPSEIILSEKGQPQNAKGLNKIKFPADLRFLFRRF